MCSWPRESGGKWMGCVVPTTIPGTVTVEMPADIDMLRSASRCFGNKSLGFWVEPWWYGPKQMVTRTVHFLPHGNLAPEGTTQLVNSGGSDGSFLIGYQLVDVFIEGSYTVRKSFLVQMKLREVPYPNYPICHHGGKLGDCPRCEEEKKDPVCDHGKKDSCKQCEENRTGIKYFSLPTANDRK